MDAPLWPSFLGGHGATPAGDEGPWGGGGGLRDRWKGFAKYRRPESLARWGQSRASTAPILGLGEGPHGRYHCLDGLSSPANWRTAIPYRRWSTGDNESLTPEQSLQVLKLYQGIPTNTVRYGTAQHMLGCLIRHRRTTAVPLTVRPPEAHGPPPLHCSQPASSSSSSCRNRRHSQRPFAHCRPLPNAATA